MWAPTQSRTVLGSYTFITETILDYRYTKLTLEAPMDLKPTMPLEYLRGSELVARNRGGFYLYTLDVTRLLFDYRLLIV